MNKFASEQELRQERIRQLMVHCERSILDSIIGPFGLHHAMFDDKTGGSLPTLHNAKAGIFPDDKSRDNFSGYNPDHYDRSQYDDKKMRGPLWRELNRRLDNAEVVGDSYADKALVKGKVHMDHVVSAKEFSKDATMHLWFSEKERKKIVNDPSNLAPTSDGINTSKNDKSVDGYLANEGKVHPDVDLVRMKEHDDIARGEISKKKAVKIATEATFAVGEEALKLGIRQGLGIILRSMTQATFMEVKDIYHNGLSPTPDDRIDSLMVRGKRIKVAALDSAHGALKGGARGAVAGVVSELLTWLINQGKTTAKNLVRIIREGILKFVEAIKLILTRPAEMTFDEALREATKIISGVLGLALGIAAEESLKALLLSMPFVNAFAAEIAAVMAGILAGVVMGAVVYLIDIFFDKMSMPFETRSLDLLAQNGSMQQQLFEGVTLVSETYAGVIEKLEQLEVNYDLALADGETVKKNYVAMIEEGKVTSEILLRGIK